MAEKIRLVKSETIRLSKVVDSLRKVTAGMGWKPSGYNENDWDLDQSLIVIDKNGRVANEISWRNKERSREFFYHGDDLVGGSGYGEQDDEQIDINFQNLSSNYSRIIVVMNIYRAFEKRQKLSQVHNAYIRLRDENTGKELVEYRIENTPQFDNMTGMIVGEFYKENGEWVFKAIGEPVCVSSIDRLVGIVAQKFADDIWAKKKWEDFLKEDVTFDQYPGSFGSSDDSGGRRRGGFFSRLFG